MCCSESFVTADWTFSPIPNWCFLRTWIQIRAERWVWKYWDVFFFYPKILSRPTMYDLVHYRSTHICLFFDGRLFSAALRWLLSRIALTTLYSVLRSMPYTLFVLFVLPSVLEGLCHLKTWVEGKTASP